MFLLYYCVGTTLCFPRPNRVTGDPDSDHLVVKKVDDSHNLWYKSSDRLPDSDEDATKDDVIAEEAKGEDVDVENSDYDAFAQNAEGEDGIANAEDDDDNSDDDTVADDDSEDDPLVVQFPEGDHFMLIPKVRVLVLVSGLVVLSIYSHKSELFVTPARAPPCHFMTILFSKAKRKA